MPAPTAPSASSGPLTCRITSAAPADTLLVFDKDGVLLDLNSTWLPVVVAIGSYLEERCGGATSRDDLLAAVGVEMTPGTDQGIITENSIFAAGTFAHMREVWSTLEPKLIPVFADFDSYRADIDAIVTTTARGQTIPKGEVKSGLTRLKSMGFKLAVATNDNTASAMVNLEDLGIDALFDIVICADSGFGRKPEGGGLLEACRATGITPDRAIMVGDTATDFLAAQDAGFKGFITIADNAPARPDFIPHADAVLAGVDELADLLTS
ncbi:MAG: HAD family hydrolase [Alphaproteobacteria bacterium]|nr:HAD family hydrolase [Alphaproteobacteria bacterium]